MGPGHDTQEATIAFLRRPESYPGRIGPVERIDTHISAVFLAGDRAYKLKRAVRFPYLDFSTAALRRAACEAEITVNRRTAPALYLGLGAVVRIPGGGLALRGPEEIFADASEDVADWLVVMRRFAQEDLFDAMARRGALDSALMADLAETIARFHGEAAVRPEFGGRAGMAKVLAVAGEALAQAGRGLLDSEDIARVRTAGDTALAQVAALLDARRAAGRVRRCHGDLHLRNICLVDGGPVLFDAIEFSEEIASVDVLYDLAFLLMDLEQRGLRTLANVVFNRYLAVTGDYDGLAALPLFLASRATIRSHVCASAAAVAAPAEAKQLGRDSADYLAHALAFLAPPPAHLLAVGGLSGTGKSTLGRMLAPEIGPPPGALHLRSDLIRKELAGVAPLARLGEDAYGEDMTARVYGTLRDRAAAALTAGHGVVADAVFARPAERRAIAEAADKSGVAFHGLWLDANAETCEARIAARTADASDATVAVFRRQKTYDIEIIDWHRLDAGGGLDDTVAAARVAIGAPTATD